MKTLQEHLNESVNINYKDVLDMLHLYLSDFSFKSGPSDYDYDACGIDVMSEEGLVSTLNMHDSYTLLADDYDLHPEKLEKFIIKNEKKLQKDLEKLGPMKLNQKLDRYHKNIELSF